MLSISQLNQYYGESHTLWDVELTAATGQCTCLMGRNGVGKTTLLKAIMGLLPVKSGTIHYQNTAIESLSTAQRAKLGIGYVPQGRDIFSQLSVEENLKVPLSALGKTQTRFTEKIYELFPVLKEMLQRRGGDLSGGQQQQLAIARALVLEPSFLILDEPTEGIQPNIVSQIGEVINYLNKEENISVLVVEQKIKFAKKIADSFYIMEKGRTVANGSIDELDDEIINKHLAV